MKKLIQSTLCAILMLSIYSNSFAQLTPTIKSNDDHLKEFYQHLVNNIKYPIKAQQSNLHGNSIILFSVIDGKLKDLKIENELGAGMDTEVLNNILTFANYKYLEPGKYALQSTFILDGSKSKIINNDATTPEGYSKLKIAITAISPVVDNKYGNFKFKTSEPLIILDGETISSGLNSIAPENIESLVVLKDLSSITKYG